MAALLIEGNISCSCFLVVAVFFSLDAEPFFPIFIIKWLNRVRNCVIELRTVIERQLRLVKAAYAD